MKKILLSVAAVAMALSASAQSTMSYDLTEVPTNAQVVTDVTDITVTYGGEKSVDKTGTPIAASSANEEGDVWKNALKKKGFKYTIDETTYSFTGYAEAVDNTRGATFAFDANAPVYGGFVKYEPVTDGQIVAYFYIPDNKAVVVTEINKNGEGTNLVSTGDAKIYVEDGDEVSVSETGIPDATYKKTVGVIVWNVKGGNTYYLMLNGSKIGVGGFIFASTGQTSDPDPEPAEGQEFSLKGSWPTGEFGTIKTPFAIDYDTQTITLKNFLGGSEDVVLNYAIRDAALDPTMPGTMFNITPVSGIGEEVNGACPVTGLQGKSVIFTEDGVNTIKLDSPSMWFGTYSSIEYKTGGFYEVTLYLQAAYATWENNAWVDVTTSKGYFELVTTVPASANQSGIENITTDNVDENAPVEYYNLQGIRLSEPAAGQIVIRRQGSKVSKILVR